MKKVIILSIATVFCLACGGDTDSNSNNSYAPMNPATKQYNSQPLDKDGKPIPGIPDPKQANISNLKPDGTPIPGIPDPGNVDVTNKQGPTPIPGIPNAEERKKMIEEMKKNPNAVNTAPKNAPAGSDKRSPGGPLNRPRKVGN